MNSRANHLTAAWQGYLTATLTVAAFTALAWPLARFFSLASLSLLFIVAVLTMAARNGLGPSLLASLFAFLAFNFFFTPPHYTFTVEHDSDLATLLLFLLVAAITGNLTARMQRQSAISRASLARVNKLYEFARCMSAARDKDEVASALCNHLSSALGGAAAVLLPGADGQLQLQQQSPPGATVPLDSIAKQWPQKTGGVATLDGWSMIPLGTGRGPLGVITIALPLDDNSQRELAQSLCDQAALALDRIQLAADLEQARIVSETEQLRSALLSSVSHDLRTPLASIIGSTSSLLEYGDSFKATDRRELLRTVLDEARRLDRYIQNLLDMTRLGEGKLQLKRDWVDLHDLIASAVERSRLDEAGLMLEVRIERDLPLLWIHGVLIEQALVNLLDNAIGFSPAGGKITIAARHEEQRISIDICDQGPGIPASEREKVFDMFYSARRGGSDRSQGTGLGLAICRGLVGAHGGDVSAHPAPNASGTCMRVELPLVTPVGIAP